MRSAERTLRSLRVLREGGRTGLCGRGFSVAVGKETSGSYEKEAKGEEVPRRGKGKTKED